MNSMQRVFALTLVQVICSFSFSQEFTPVVNQFSKTDYNASNQNWSVGQGKDGILYFGNNDGLLEFDGSKWEMHKIADNKLVRSVLCTDDDRIYVGSFEEFGYFEKDNFGNLHYISLSAKLPNYKMQNDEIWTILNYNGTIIFQSFTSYFTYKNGELKGVRSPYTFLFFNVYNNKIYTHTEQLGFSVFDPAKNTFLAVNNELIKSEVISVLKFDQTKALLVTKSDGLFLFDGTTVSKFVTDADDEIKRAELNRAVILPNGLIVVGSILNGATAIDKSGRKQWTLNTSNVLRNNTILVFFTHYSFLGLDPRNLSDQYANYWTQNTAHAQINYEYCAANPRHNFGYSSDCWGLTASDIPNGYTASSPNNDGGTIAPTAALSSFPYTPEESMKALRFFYYILGDKIFGDYGFKDAFNLNQRWFASSYLAIDQGPIVVMIENYRTGLLWNLFMQNQDVKAGLTKLNFDF